MNEEIKENIRKQFQSAERKHVNINSTWVIVAKKKVVDIFYLEFRGTSDKILLRQVRLISKAR